MRRFGVSIGLAMMLVAACGSSVPTLIGYVPTGKSVASATATEATSKGTTTFSFVPSAGNVLIVYFGYTNCPDLCPTTMSAVRSAKKMIGTLANKVDLAMVTVDSQRDTGTVLTKYLSSFSTRYHALVPANERELNALKAVFQASSSVTTNMSGNIEVSHSGTTYVVAPSGDVVVEWPFGLQADAMANDLRITINGLNEEEE